MSERKVCVGCKGERTTTVIWEEKGLPDRETVGPCIVCGGSGVQPDLSTRYRGPVATAIEDEAAARARDGLTFEYRELDQK